jgi:hypothetical protein
LEFSNRFLEEDVDDPALNQALVEAFWGDFHLCSAFKTLFVYSRASPLERRLRFNNLPAWALQSDKIYQILPRVLPDLESSPERVVFENELRFPYFGAGDGAGIHQVLRRVLPVLESSAERGVFDTELRVPQFGAGGGGGGAPENVIQLPGMGVDTPWGWN